MYILFWFRPKGNERVGGLLRIPLNWPSGYDLFALLYSLLQIVDRASTSLKHRKLAENNQAPGPILWNFFLLTRRELHYIETLYMEIYMGFPYVK